MTPATKQLDQAKVSYRLHRYEHDPKAESYGTEAADKLGLDAAQVFKTLLAASETGELLVAIVPVNGKLNLKNLASAAGVKKAAMADPAAAQRSTGYLVGGISPLGQKKRLRTYLDESAGIFETIFVSGGRRGLEIELAPTDLAKQTQGKLADIGRSE
ncbi:Cys-tRNA(Pro)/Cys-tRNA(Cys) deacylase [Halopseudomonas xinjiangensis]|uniref:Cys-tRNA(Pro)/Cys-tRNA(Cys) deacylase n=1 Tax=Halopseudomonas xinjiangensis TaxID=487184 RepID=A0A1H1TI40_9GAMM|nr:Cys-tRNA(Pro) deacylase [Halopseudomonas xinjiangensis]SDS59860.1 Cys-tRNA(Pro)/Cys-tRNA(Cys) deacylase [Halopseudomonas xinjiangensis]